jgi:hypothetical protein
MNTFYIAFGLGFVLISIVLYRLRMEKKRAFTWWIFFPADEPTEWHFKVLSGFEFLFGIFFVVLGIM